MAIRDRGALKQTAAARLGTASYNPKKLALIHAGAAVGLSLVISLLDLALSRQIGSTGGLSGLGTRSILETVRTILQYVRSIALPFWEFGFIFAAIRMARGEAVGPASLPEGFRRFGPVLRLQLLQGLLYSALATVFIYVASIVVAVLPLSQPLMELAENMTEVTTVEQAQQMISQLPAETILQIAAPMMAIFGVLCAVVLIPLSYRLRLSGFLIMDAPGTGALMAMAGSVRIMRRNCMKWFRLDLSFWWYYGIMAIAAVIGYADLLLPMVGLRLPMSADVAWIVFYLMGLAVQLVLSWQGQSQVQTTYAVAYDVLRQQPPYTPPVKPAPQNLPWDEYQGN